MVATQEMVVEVVAVKGRVAASQADQRARPGAGMAVAAEMEVVKGAEWTEAVLQEAVGVGGRREEVVVIGERTWTRRVESSAAELGGFEGRSLLPIPRGVVRSLLSQHGAQLERGAHKN